ncbi:hypothetical protein BSK48_05615 [Paenibacillus odorifer]|nr:hypothetical protein BSK48_05615 [Paenibacillus odorifer]
MAVRPPIRPHYIATAEAAGLDELIRGLRHMKNAWETFKTLCAMLVIGFAIHELLIGVVHADPVYWINW